MRGTDCAAEQIASASSFLGDRGWPLKGLRAVLTRDDAVRLIAWYGAMRFVAGRDGTGGTLEHPGVLEIVDREEVTHMRNHEGASEGQDETGKGATEGAGQTEDKPTSDNKPEPAGD